MTTDAEYLGRIRTLRRRKAITQKELAQLAGVSVGTLLSAEKGLHGTHASNLKKIAGALGVEPEELWEKRP